MKNANVVVKVSECSRSKAFSIMIIKGQKPLYIV